VNLAQPRWISATVRCGVAVTFVILVSADPADTDVLTGRIYPLGASGGRHLFTWQLEREAGSTWRSFYRTPAGELTAADETVWQAGEFRSYRYERPPLGESARLERQGD
jgi:hypothetical protein